VHKIQFAGLWTNIKRSLDY